MRKGVGPLKGNPSPFPLEATCMSLSQNQPLKGNYTTLAHRTHLSAYKNGRYARPLSRHLHACAASPTSRGDFFRRGVCHQFPFC